MNWREFVEEIFLIHLFDFPEHDHRLGKSILYLAENNIPYTLVKAIYNEHGVIGLLQTMKQIFQNVLSGPNKNIMILEDDFRFVLPFDNFMNLILSQLPADYHCLYLGCNLLNQPERYSDNLLRIQSSYTTHAIVYSREAIELILPMLDQVLAYDIILMKSIQPLRKCYCTYPMFCFQHEGYSSIDKQWRNWEKLSAETYAMNTKRI